VTTTYTEFQKRAIEADGTDICVAAGAGSGKTGVLVERFVRLIVQSKNGELPPEQHGKVDEILVITFTEKATKEMKTRIVAALNQLGLIDERRAVETAYISTIHGFGSRLLQENPFEAGVDPQFKVIDETQARRLLRQVFEEVIADAYAREEEEVTELVAALQFSRTQGEETGDPLVVLAEAVERTMNRLRGAGVTLEKVEAHHRQGLDSTAARSLDPVWAFLTPLLHEIEGCRKAIAALSAGAMGAIQLACQAVEERATLFAPYGGTVEETLGALQEILKATDRVRVRSGALPREIELAQILARIKIACQEAKDLFDLAVEREAEAALRSHRLWGLTVATWRAYAEAKRRESRLDNDDLQMEAVRLLESAPHVCQRYRRRFRHIMVDEFQDTNPVQMRLVELLHVSAPNPPAPFPTSPRSSAGKGEIFALSKAKFSPFPVSAANEAGKGVGGLGATRNFLFVVGDVQQSIYGFRNADSTLFRGLERQFREEKQGLHVPLAVNFRSRPEILQAVETVFRQIWREETTPFVPLTCGAEFDPKPTPSVEALLTQELRRGEYVPLEAEALATRVRQMVEGEEFRLTHPYDARRGEPVRYRDIAILMRALTDIQKYEEAFARKGVPFFVVGGGRGYYARHEIRDVMNVLTVLDTPLDDVALAATLRSPFVGADVDTLYRLAIVAQEQGERRKVKGESREKSGVPLYLALGELLESGALPEEEQRKVESFVEIIEKLREQEDRLPVGHLLERLIAWTQYDVCLLARSGGRRRLANVRKLLQMANSDSVMGVRDFIRRLRDMEKLSDREGDAPTEEEASDVVRFITIHGAKGLEFPVVILSDLSRGLLRPERGQFVCDPHHMALGVRVDGETNVAYKAIDKRRLEADKRESARLLYVAMTRAREHLVLCGNLGRNWGENWADSLFPLLGILDAPQEPEMRTLVGGIAAQVAPLAHYVHAGSSEGSVGATQRGRREAEARADRVARAIMSGESVESALGIQEM
jgi:ATP-dependent helicase/nuclease subunit A